MNTIVIKNQYSAAELAQMQIEGLPTTKPGIQLRAANEGWQKQVTTGVGGARTVFSPPPKVMDAIRAKAAHNVIVAGALDRRIATTQQMPLIATGAQTLVADSRKGVLLALETLMNRSGYAMKKAARVMLEMAESGEAGPQLVNMLKMARDGRGRPSESGLPSVRTLLRFVEYSNAGELAPRIPTRDMSVPDWAPTFMECYQRPEKPTAEHAYRQFCELAPQRGFDQLPSIHQVRRFLGKVGKVSREMGRMGAHELKNIQPFVRRDFSGMRPTDIYSADGHCFDAEVQHPIHGRPFRPEITSVIDIATRSLVGWSIGLAESALVVADALKHASIHAGIPALFYVDNGSGYANQMMKDQATGLMGRLGITMTHSLPYNSQAKGVIERSHRTIWVAAAKELPGYIGKDMDRQAKLATFKVTRKAVKASKGGEARRMPLLDWESFVSFAKLKVEQYNDRPHRALGKIRDPETGRRRHMSPNEAWALAVSNGFGATRVSDDQVDSLFRPQVLRTINRAEINLFNNTYFSNDLAEFHGLQMAIGYDVQDASKVWVYDDAGRFICTAGFRANTKHYMPTSVHQQANDKRADRQLAILNGKAEEIELVRRGVPALEQMESITIPGLLNISRDELETRRRDSILVEVNRLRPST